MIESQFKRHKTMTEFERERDQKYFEFKRLEAEKNREHELKIAQLFAFVIQSLHSGGRMYSQNFHQLHIKTFHRLSTRRCQRHFFHGDLSKNMI